MLIFRRVGYLVCSNIDKDAYFSGSIPEPAKGSKIDTYKIIGYINLAK